MTFFCKNADDEAFDEIEAFNEDKEYTYAEMRHMHDLLADEVEEWHGIPIPLPDLPLRLYPGHPMQEFFSEHQRELDGGPQIEIIVGGPEHGESNLDLSSPAALGASIIQQAKEETLRSIFYCRKAQATIYIYERDGRVFHAKRYRSPDLSMDRLDLWLTTLGASDAWSLEAEAKALEKLADLVTERQIRHYLLTGCFLEISPRSDITYLFRKLRPTVALTPRNRHGHDSMTCIGVLCMHPLGYYGRSWAGCMVPTDDVIAHLLHMRADEARWWGKCNQHEPWRPEAGL